MFLTKEAFSEVIDKTPLVSIDLVIKDSEGLVLLGERKNRPAQGYWFVPGGRILKNELIADAFERLTLDELGESISILKATLQGPYDHFYADSVFGKMPSTHYVAIAYRVEVVELNNLPSEQHSHYRWFSVEELLSSDKVHQHTKNYFL